MATKHLVIRIKDLVVTSNGDLPGTKPSHDDDNGLLNNSLLASLTYPRSGASQVVSVKQYDLKDNTSATLLDPDNPDPFFDPLLFREDVRDQTVLNVRVTNFDATSKAVKFFLTLFEAILGAAIGIATSGLSTVIGAVVGFGVDQIKDELGHETDNTVHGIGKASMVLKVADFSETPVIKQLDLIAPETTTARIFVQNPVVGQPPIEKEIVLVTKGKSNGTLTLEITAVDV